MKTNGLGRVVAALALMAAGAFASANPSLSVPTLGGGTPAARAENKPSTPVHLSDAAIAAGLGLLGLMSGRKKTKRPE
jgi:hypothetical protein